MKKLAQQFPFSGFHPSLVFPTVMIALTSLGAAQEESVYWLAGVPGEELGRGVVSIEDLDGDGIRDLVSGSVELDPAVRARSGATGKPLWTADVEDYPDFWPMSAHTLTAIGDIDLDGVTDLIIGCHACGFGGTVCLISGRNGSKIWCYTDPEVLNKVGVSALAVGDVDGDGVADIAVGAPNDEPAPGVAAHGNLGSVRLLSGASANEIWRTFGPEIEGQFGSGYFIGGALGAAPDCDGDGIGEIIAAPVVAFATTPDGVKHSSPLLLLSGGTGEVLESLPVPVGLWASYAASAALPDLTGDGVGEVLVGFPRSSDEAIPNSVVLFDGGTWNVLHEWQNTNPKMSWGGSMAPIADLDGDGINDVIVGVFRVIGQFSANTPAGMVRILSPGTKEVLVEIIGAQSGGWHTNFGQTVGSMGDINGDGVEEFFVGAPWWDPLPTGINQIGRLDVYSPVPRTLSANKPFVFAAQGGVQSLTIRPGPAHAGEIYMLLGSFEGIVPAFPLEGFDLPLVFDGYTATQFASNGGPLVSSWIGTLDAQGQALATVTIPPLVGSLSTFVGRTVWHSALTLSPLGSVSAVTNAVALSFAP
jgi:hypothetical protein